MDWLERARQVYRNVAAWATSDYTLHDNPQCWVYGTDSEDNFCSAEDFHGAQALSQLWDPATGLNGQFVIVDAEGERVKELICLGGCHELGGAGSFIALFKDLPPRTETKKPQCNSCHSIHSFYPDPSGGTALIGQMFGLQTARLTPDKADDWSLSCPVCHESKRPPANIDPNGSRARVITDYFRHEHASCNAPGACHGPMPVQGGE